MAVICAGQSLKSPHSVTSSGMACRRASIVPPARGGRCASASGGWPSVVSTVAGGSAAAWVSHWASVSGRWKANTGRARGAGSSPFVKCVSTPVDS